MKTAKIVSISVLALALIGAGCRPLADKGSEPQPVSGPRVSTFNNLTPQEAAQKVNFVPGGIIEMRQTFMGFGAQLAAKLAGEKKEGTRVIVINRFAPMNVASLSWKLSTKVESDQSKQAREKALKNKQPVPEPVMVNQTAKGDVAGFNLKDTRLMYLPAYWPEKEDAPSLGTSGIWLSADVFEGLARTRVATLDFGILNSELQSGGTKAVDFSRALGTLGEQVKKIGDRTDVYLLKGEPETIAWPLKVNGQEIKVDAIKARSWFGEIIVLNNKQNPLVLKMTFNPLAAGTAGTLTGLGPLAALFGYEITELKDVQE